MHSTISHNQNIIVKLFFLFIKWQASSFNNVYYLYILNTARRTALEFFAQLNVEVLQPALPSAKFSIFFQVFEMRKSF